MQPRTWEAIGSCDDGSGGQGCDDGHGTVSCCPLPRERVTSRWGLEATTMQSAQPERRVGLIARKEKKRKRTREVSDGRWVEFGGRCGCAQKSRLEKGRCNGKVPRLNFRRFGAPGLASGHPPSCLTRSPQHSRRHVLPSTPLYLPAGGAAPSLCPARPPNCLGAPQLCYPSKPNKPP